MADYDLSELSEVVRAFLDAKHAQRYQVSITPGARTLTSRGPNLRVRRGAPTIRTYSRADFYVHDTVH